MKPVFKAIDMFDEHEESFLDVLDRHLADGWVYSGDDCFIMATLENSDRLLKQNLNKSVDTDTWFVYVYVGNIVRAIELMPFKKKYIAFRRNNGLMKIHETSRLLDKIRR